MEKLTELYNSIAAELVKHEAGNKAAGTRARLLATEMQKHLAQIRKDILNSRKNKN